MEKGLALTAVGLLIIWSCEAPVSDSGEGWVVASVSGAVEAEYEGTGIFAVTNHTGLQAVMFGLHSEDSTSAFEGQWLNVSRFGEVPSVGRHPAVESDTMYDRRSGLRVGYERRSGGWMEAYESVAGELEVTHSSAERLEGRFDIKAVRYCRTPLVSSNAGAETEGSCDPRVLDRAAPSIQLIGSFVAVRVQGRDATRVPTRQ